MYESIQWYHTCNLLTKIVHFKRKINNEYIFCYNNKKNIYLNSINNSINYTKLRDSYK